MTLGATNDRVHTAVAEKGSGTQCYASRTGSTGWGDWGLQLVHTIADDWGTETEDHRTIVWFERRLLSNDHSDRS